MPLAYLDQAGNLPPAALLRHMRRINSNPRPTPKETPPMNAALAFAAILLLILILLAVLGHLH